MDNKLDEGVVNLIDMPVEVFDKHIEGKHLGYLMSLKNLVATSYNQTQKVKEEVKSKLVKLIDKKTLDPSISVDEAKETLNQIYKILHNLEYKYTKLEQTIARITDSKGLK